MGGEGKCRLHYDGTWMTPLVGGNEGNISKASGIIAPGIPSIMKINLELELELDQKLELGLELDHLTN